MLKNTQPLIVFLMGPTATGKTDLALRLVEKLPVEIISVDSAMIYRGLNIGTGKPDKNILEKIPHHLIDILDAKEIYSAAEFRQNALKIIESILAKNKIPLLVGGTMLYFKALREGIANLPSADIKIRAKLNEELKEYGLTAMHERLQKLDPQAAAKIHPNDPQRLLRALEINEITGKNLNVHFANENNSPLPYRCLQIALTVANRNSLHQKIADRFQQMLAAGFIDEVESLKKRGDLDMDLPSMRSVGYRQIWQYLQNQLTYEEMSDQGIIATRQLAKRQLTWLRSWPDVNSFDYDQKDLTTSVINTIDNYFGN